MREYSKRIWSLVLALALVMAWLPAGVLAADEVASGTCGENLTWVLDSEGTLTISGTGKMEDFDWSPWSENENIVMVVIENGVTSIGSWAFYGCSCLTSVTIPDSVTWIGEYTFCLCSSLSSVVIPVSVNKIYSYAFAHCTALASVEMQSGVTGIGAYAFWGCTSLTSVQIPDSVISIGDFAFHGCTGLTSITFEGDAPIYHGDDAPIFGLGVFDYVTAIAYYPAGNDTWTKDVIQECSGTLTWVAYYSVMVGEECQVTPGQDAAVRVDCAVDKFVSVSVDGEVVDPANYTVTEGSTVVTFHADWLKTLSVGEHSVEIQFTDGVANAILTVEQAYLLGDINNDGEIDIFDANAAAAYANELRDLDDTQLLAGDVNGDGEVDIFDANLIAAYANELLAKFPAEP